MEWSLSKCILTLSLLVLFGCTSAPAASENSPTPSQDSGIQGTLLIRQTGGPNPTPLPPYEASSGVLQARNDETHVVTRFRAALDGSLRVALPPGHYRIDLVVPRTSIFVPVNSRAVEVTAHRYKHVVLRIWLDAP